MDIHIIFNPPFHKLGKSRTHAVNFTRNEFQNCRQPERKR